MSLKRRVTNLEKHMPHDEETHIIQWAVPGPITHLKGGGQVWTRHPNEDEDSFIDRAMAAAGNTRFLWGSAS